MLSLSHQQFGLSLLLFSVVVLIIKWRWQKERAVAQKSPKTRSAHAYPQRKARSSIKPEKPELEETAEITKILERLEHTSDNIFLTGKAGTGKSTILKYFLNTTEKSYAVVAPTGIAAINVNGQTIHSFFGFAPNLDPINVKPLTHDRLELIQNLECLIIDEISMVRADLLDCIEKCLHLSRDDDRPFGGVQIIAIGDPFQLPPVLKKEDLIHFSSRYQHPHFFGANSYLAGNFTRLELTKVHRQSDPTFIHILNAIRVGDVDNVILQQLHERTRSAVEQMDSIKLVATNESARKINQQNLNLLPGDTVSYRGQIEGNFNESNAPTDMTLLLKRGARVMLLNNQRERKWVNGDLAEILELEPNSILVKFDDGTMDTIEVHRWEQIVFRYDKESKSVISEVVGSFTQFPLKLAWAITIHKSQGQSYHSVHIDLGSGAFAPGQAYVALSRCRTLEGITLSRPIRESDIITDSIVRDFMNIPAAERHAGNF